MEDEAENMQALINNERREEIATLTEMRQNFTDLREAQTTASEIMILSVLLTNAWERIRELRDQIATK